MNAFFNLSLAKKLSQKQKADIIIANNVLGHVNDLQNFISGISILLKESGILFLKYHILMNYFEKLEFDTIYHEHISYFL